MKRWLVALLVLVAPLASVAFAQANVGPGTKVVKEANEKISALLKQKADPSKVTTAVRDFLDIDELGKRAMVDQWSKLTPAQQQEYLTTLRSLIEDNYAKGLRSNLNYTVDYTGESTDANDLVVTTQVNTQRHNHPYKIAVDYVLKQDGDKLKCWDVKTDGVGLVENYRTQFNKIIDHDGFKGLIEKMKKKQGEETAPAGSGSGSAAGSAASKPGT